MQIDKPSQADVAALLRRQTLQFFIGNDHVLVLLDFVTANHLFLIEIVA